MIFYKTSSFGNDFIEIEALSLPAGADPGAIARAVCDRQRGVGADGLVLFWSERRQVHFEIFNRDGGRAELSGNGMAGLASVLFQRRLAASPVTLHAAIGARRVGLLARRGPLFQLDVEIGRPDFANRRFFPFLEAGQSGYAVAGVELFPVSVGNPHAVVLVDGPLEPRRLAALGKKLEGHPMFPERVNVEFVQIIDGERCRVFFYERGVGPTLASSTGSSAVFAVLRRLGRTRDLLTIECGPEPIAVSWRHGIHIHNYTRLVCRGDFFA